jgi:hypothetical protein
LYWSARRVEEVATGHDVDLGPRPTTEWSTPALGPLPIAKRRRPAQPLSKLEQANALEGALDHLVDRAFRSTQPCAFAGGRTTVTFARLENVHERERAVIFAEVKPDVGLPVAICLFGTMTNFIEFLGNARESLSNGWSSSAAPEVLEFIESRCSVIPETYSDRAAIAVEALKIADGQGLSGDGNNPVNWRPWRRAFTFGDVRDTAEWLAEVYCDIDLLSETGETYDGYGRVIIGAPLWIMTPYVKDVRLYEEHALTELDPGRRSIRARLRSWRQSPGRQSRDGARREFTALVERVDAAPSPGADRGVAPPDCDAPPRRDVQS